MNAVRLRPAFLDRLLGSLRASSTPIIALRDVPAATTDASGKPFVCFTLDDGYRDNYKTAWPIFRHWQVPFTVFLTTDFIDGTLPMCWSLLERCVRRADKFVLSDGERRWNWPTRTAEEKQAAFDEAEALFRCGNRSLAKRLATDLYSRYGPELWDQARRDALDWDRVREMAADPLVDIGAHTLSHPLLGELERDEARRQIVESKLTIEREIDRPVRHFAFPFGDSRAIGRHGISLAREAGFDLAVTTRRAVFTAADVKRPYELPRITLDSRYESISQVRGQLCGAPAAVKGLIDRSRSRRFSDVPRSGVD
jgi:peptidoglycan/xylan/chitin deacetylase (PgdA/CDA1 family)